MSEQILNVMGGSRPHRSQDLLYRISPSVSWCNATTPFLGMAFGPTHWHVPSGMKQALTYYGLSTIDLPVEQLLYIEPG